jgi:hypothetical protein
MIRYCMTAYTILMLIMNSTDRKGMVQDVLFHSGNVINKGAKNIRNCLTYGQYGKHEDQATLSTLATVSAFTILVCETFNTCLSETYGANSLCLQHI